MIKVVARNLLWRREHGDPEVVLIHLGVTGAGFVQRADVNGTVLLVQSEQ